MWCSRPCPSFLLRGQDPEGKAFEAEVVRIPLICLDRMGSDEQRLHQRLLSGGCGSWGLQRCWNATVAESSWEDWRKALGVVSCCEVRLVVLKLYHHGSRWSAAMEEWEHGRSSFHGSSAKPTETTWKRFIPSCQAHACLWPWRCIHWQLGGPTTTRIWRPGTETVHPPWPISIDLAIQMTFTAMAGLAGWCALWRYLGRVEPLVDLLCLVVKLWLSWRRNVEVRLPLCRRLEGRQSTWLGQAVGKSSVTWHTWEAGPIYWCRRDVSRFTTIVIVDPNLFSASSPSLSTTGWFFKMMLTCSQGEKMREDERSKRSKV